MNRKNCMILVLILLVLVASTVNGHAQQRQGMTVNGAAGVVSCSSYCDEYEDIKFTPGKAFNGNPSTPWMAAEKFNPKEGEWIKFTFTKPVSLVALRIAPGFGHSTKRFYEYPRLKRFKIILQKPSGGGYKNQIHEYIRRLDGAPYKDLVLLYSTQPRVKSIKLQILEIYKGKGKNNAVVGNIEPILIRDGKTKCSSAPLFDILTFLKSTRSASGAFSFVPSGKPIVIKKFFRNANPLDDPYTIKKSRSYTRASLKKSWNVWKDLCRMIFTDYEFSTYNSVNYFWKNRVNKKIYFDMFGSESADVMNSYQLEMSRQKVTETIKKKDKETDEEKKVTIEVIRTVVEEIRIVSDIYTP